MLVYAAAATILLWITFATTEERLATTAAEPAPLSDLLRVLKDNRPLWVIMTIFVFGILGLCVCMIFGIVAWVMGSGDMQAMEFGEMDSSGYALTKAGKICGMISVILTVLGLCLYGILIMFVIGVIMLISLSITASGTVS